MNHFNLLSLVIFVFASQSLVLPAQTNVNSADVSYDSFGEKIDADPAQSVDAAATILAGKDSVRTKIKGIVQEVCQVKGCWMTISGKASQSSLFVKFKDYGFFVPKDISGKEVIMEGVAYRELTSVEELQHYAKDAGKNKEEIMAITEPKEELRFLAKGVLVKK